MKSLFVSLLLLLVNNPVAAADEPFFSLLKSSGNITVKLYPTEVVKTGSSVLVSFGMPFTRGSITTAGLRTVRVLKSGTEIPAYVDQLTPWRHATKKSIDLKSVRVARIQFSHTFSAAYPAFESLTIEWGLHDRAKNVTTLRKPRSAWHLVSSGTFVAADLVYEPDVYVVLPTAALTQGVLRPGRMNPFSNSVASKRDSPTAMCNKWNWPGYQELEHAAKNNFYTIINEDDPHVTKENLCDYKNALSDTNGEPWLYDRSSAMFGLYFRSGFFRALREAVRSAEYYRNHLSRAGFFTLKDYDDPKYSYSECLAYLCWTTGDQQSLAGTSAVVSAFKDVTARWNSSLNFWTERHAGFKLLANVVAYEVYGTSGYRDAVLSEAKDFIWHQNGAGGLIPANHVDGGLYHLGSQHDWDWDQDSYGASPWMTVLLLDAMVRAFAVTEDPLIAKFIQRVGAFEKAAMNVTKNHLYEYGPYENQALAVPVYALLADGTFGATSWEDSEHALDVASALAWASYFANLLGSPDPTLRQAAVSYYKTYQIGVNYWIRPDSPVQYGKTAFRVSPWRKYGWEHRVSASFSWIISP